MPVKMTKAQIEKLLVAERKKSRIKQQQSKFMSKTLSIYGGQKKRYAELTGNKNAELPYTLQELRVLVTAALNAGICPYSGDKLTLVKLTVDHDIPVSRGGSWELTNLVICTTSSNWQKGLLTSEEYLKLIKGLRKSFPEVVVTDILRRLSLGGKWTQTQFRG